MILILLMITFVKFLSFNFVSFGMEGQIPEKEKIILQRDFKNNNGLLRAIPERQKATRPIGEAIANVKKYGRLDDTNKLKAYFESFNDNDPVKKVMIDIINSHQGPGNLTVDELKSKMAREENLTQGSTSRAAVMVFGNKDIMQLLGEMLTPLELASMKQVCSDTVKPAQNAEKNNQSHVSYPQTLEYISLNKKYQLSEKIKTRLDSIFNDPRLSIKDKMHRWYDNHGRHNKTYPLTYIELWDYLKNYHPDYLKDFVLFKEGNFNNIVNGVPDLRTFLDILNEFNRLGGSINFNDLIMSMHGARISKEKMNRILLHVINNLNNNELGLLATQYPFVLDRLVSSVDNSFFQEHFAKVINIPHGNRYSRMYSNKFFYYLTHPSICAQFAKFYIEDSPLLHFYIERAKSDQREYIHCFFEVAKKYGLQKYQIFDEKVILRDLNVFLDEFRKNPELLNSINLDFLIALIEEISRLKDSFTSHRQIYNVLLHKLSLYLMFNQKINVPKIWNIYKKIKSIFPLEDNMPESKKNNNKHPAIEKTMALIDTSCDLGQYIMQSLKGEKKQKIINDKDEKSKKQAYEILKNIDLSKQFDRYVYVMIMEKMEYAFSN